MKILFHGEVDRVNVGGQWAVGLGRIPGVEVISSPLPPQPKDLARQLIARVAWRLRWPIDFGGENEQLLRLCREHRPDVVLVCNSKLLKKRTLRRLRTEGVRCLAYTTMDDIVAPHNMSGWLRQTLGMWDIFFTTKRFLLTELPALGVKRTVLTTNFFSSENHRPMTPEEVGPEYEAFDLVFVGTFEPAREQSLRRLAELGFKVLVHGNAAGLIAGSWSRLRQSGVTVRPSVLGPEYSKAIHRGKIALGFLRKINRDEITNRSVELPAMGRAMLAERTREHDLHLEEGREYVGFSSEEELIEKARELLADPERRARIGAAGRARVFASGYDVDTEMRKVVVELQKLCGPADAQANSS